MSEDTQYSRTKMLIGQDAQKTLQRATVLVFGVGGVGSHCIEALARGGIGKLIIVDYDVVAVSNINRQSIAYHSTIGQHKTKIMKERLLDICPDMQVQTFETFVNEDNIKTFFEDKIDYVVDAIDTVTAKLQIIAQAKERNIPLICSMGTGNKLHGEHFEIDKLENTSMCPLCKVMRKEVRTRGLGEVKVLYSKEKPVETKERTPGSISFVPPVAGLLIAGEVIRRIYGSI